MIVNNSKGVKEYPYMYLGNSRKRIYYDPYIRKRPHGWLLRQAKIPINGKRECARRVRQMMKIAEKKTFKLVWVGNILLSNRYLEGVIVA